MGDIGKAFRFIRANVILCAFLASWTLLAMVCQSWWRGLGALVTIGLGMAAMRFWSWRKARLEMLDKAEIQPPKMTDLARTFLLESYRMLHVTRQWRKACQSLNLTSPTLKVVPKLRHLKGTVNNDLTAGVFPGAVHADVDAFRKAEGKFAGMIRGGCKDVGIRVTSPGNAVVTFSFSREFDKVLELKDLPESPKGTLCYGVRPDGKPAWIWSHMSATFGGLTRKGKSVMCKTLIASAHRKRLPLNLYIADTKRGIEYARFEKELGIQHGTVRVVRYEKTPSGAEQMVKDMAAEMDIRADMMREKNLVQWIPTLEFPQLVGIFDETLPLHAMLKEGTKGAAGEIGFAGAAMCVSLWMNTQIAHADIIGKLRELIPQRVSFSTPTSQVTDTILGDGAASNGAECHKLGDRAGVGWSSNDESGMPRKFRSANTTPAEAANIAQGILPPEWAERKAKPKPYVLYRRVDDSVRWDRMYGERSVYIGITNDMDRRDGQHRREDWKWCDMHRAMENYWMVHGTRTIETPLNTTDIKVAQAVERKAIRAEFPVFNDHHNGGRYLARKVQSLFARPAVAAVEPDDAIPVAVEAAPSERRWWQRRPVPVETVEGTVLVEDDRSEPLHVDGVWSE